MGFASGFNSGLGLAPKRDIRTAIVRGGGGSRKVQKKDDGKEARARKEREQVRYNLRRDRKARERKDRHQEALAGIETRREFDAVHGVAQAGEDRKQNDYARKLAYEQAIAGLGMNDTSGFVNYINRFGSPGTNLASADIAEDGSITLYKRGGLQRGVGANGSVSITQAQPTPVAKFASAKDLFAKMLFPAETAIQKGKSSKPAADTSHKRWGDMPSEIMQQFTEPQVDANGNPIIGETGQPVVQATPEANNFINYYGEKYGKTGGNPYEALSQYNHDKAAAQSLMAMPDGDRYSFVAGLSDDDRDSLYRDAHYFGIDPTTLTPPEGISAMSTGRSDIPEPKAQDTKLPTAEEAARQTPTWGSNTTTESARGLTLKDIFPGMKTDAEQKDIVKGLQRVAAGRTKPKSKGLAVSKQVTKNDGSPTGKSDKKTKAIHTEVKVSKHAQGRRGGNSEDDKDDKDDNSNDSSSKDSGSSKGSK